MSGVTIFEDVFEPDFCRFLLANARRALSETNEFTRSNYHWSTKVRRGVVLVRDLPDQLITLVLTRLSERGILGAAYSDAVNYAWTPLSYVPWHRDKEYIESVAVYLNADWDPDWGGLFLYEDKDLGVRGHVPRFNTAVRNQGDTRHATTPVVLEAPEPRFTLQLFSSTPLA